MTKSTKLLLAVSTGAAIYGVFFWRQHGTNPTLFDQWRTRLSVKAPPPAGFAIDAVTGQMVQAKS